MNKKNKLFLIFKKNSSINNRLDKHQKEIEELYTKISNLNDAVSNIQKDIGDFSLNNKLNSIKNIILQFEKTTNRGIFDLNDAISNIQNDIDNVLLNKNQTTESISKPIQKQEEKKQEILFAPAPDKDGSFNISVVVSSENKGVSVYKFTLLEGQKAEFEFIDNESTIIDAVNSYEMYLKPVCTNMNSLNQKAKHIRTTKKGIVIKQNDKWILDTKAEIYYE